MDISPFKPKIWQQTLNQNLQTLMGGEQGYPAGANVIWPQGFVTLTSGLLASSLVVGAAPVLSGAGTILMGYIQDRPKANFTDQVYNPPYTDYIKAVSGTNRRTFYPIDIRGMRFLVYLTDASFHIGQADGAPTLSEVVLGGSYGMIVGGTLTPAIPSAGAQQGVFALNVDETDAADVVFKVVDIPKIVFNSQNQLASPTTTFNGAVVVEILPGKIYNGV